MKTIFLDRDGVINKDPAGWTEHNYVTDWKNFHFLPGSLEALKLLKINGIKVVLISNQAGVNKGFFSKETLDQINRKMLQEVKKIAPTIFKNSGPACKSKNICPENKKDCPLYPR